MIQRNQNQHMGLILQFSLIFLSLLFFTILGYSSSSDNTNLIFKGCANQKFQDPTGIYSKTLDNLFSTLKSQSSSNKFFKTTAGESQFAIVGLFQCRGDLSNADCSNCVSKLPKMFKSLCGQTIAARIQLGGCYKVCGSNRVSGSGFEERLGSALGEIDKGVVSGNGFYTGGYESVYVLGQCEGDLVGGDCVDCVKNAEQRAKSDCGASNSGQIYLQQKQGQGWVQEKGWGKIHRRLWLLWWEDWWVWVFLLFACLFLNQLLRRNVRSSTMEVEAKVIEKIAEFFDRNVCR